MLKDQTEEILLMAVDSAIADHVREFHAFPSLLEIVAQMGLFFGKHPLQHLNVEEEQTTVQALSMQRYQNQMVSHRFTARDVYRMLVEYKYKMGHDMRLGGVVAVYGGRV